MHLLLDLHPRFTVRDAVDNLDRLDSHFFGGLMTPHKTKLEILGGALQPEEWQTIPVPPLERVVNVAQNVFDMVLVDIGSQFSSEWSPILRMARMILIVAEANVPALWTLERRLLALKGFGIEPERARIIINRWHKGDDEVLRSIQKDINRPDFCVPSQRFPQGIRIRQSRNSVDGESQQCAERPVSPDRFAVDRYGVAAQRRRRVRSAASFHFQRRGKKRCHQLLRLSRERISAQ